ncbi:hypothetical protein [Flavihumibacter fluvii]|uniref:hypothetical protein n=1 Tax=Flavihumibacter fluvii TaxID=2838157 RepID=UPI001BDF2C5B|nr:hypothetical protein [Flavihumibacter fluvii]ULQ51996.1 hypothetical protein KJS93_18045 [Flavihumibacter fluvii]
MKKLMVMLLALVGTAAFTQIPSADLQVKTALLAAPSDKQDNAMVYGYNSKGEFLVLRKGSNEFVCIADDPKAAGLSVSCYH